jgi:hypothetical protein
VTATLSAASILDPLQQLVDLPYSARLYPLGFPLDVFTNAAEVVHCARESWSAYPKLFEHDPVILKWLVSGAPQTPGAPVYRAQGDLLSIVADRENFASCDLAIGVGFGCCTASALADSASFRFFFLEAMAYACLSSLHLTVLHGACVSIGGRGALLCGPSGSGKSCLAYAAARHGFTLVSDDSTAFLRRSGDRRVLGKPGHIRLRESAADLFSELRGMLASRAPNGKRTLEIKTSDVPGLRTAFECRVDVVVFLNRTGTNNASLHRICASDAKQRIEGDLPVLNPWSYAEQLASLDRFLAAPCYELRYGGLPAAISCLEKTLSGNL